MSRRTIASLLIASTALFGLAARYALADDDDPVPAPNPAGPLFAEVKIVTDGEAKADGEVKLTFAPVGEMPKDIRVKIQHGMSEKSIAGDIAKQLYFIMGERYKVDQYDDSKVKVTRVNTNVPEFRLTVTSNVSGLEIKLTT